MKKLNNHLITDESDIVKTKSWIVGTAVAHLQTFVVHGEQWELCISSIMMIQFGLCLKNQEQSN